MKNPIDSFRESYHISRYAQVKNMLHGSGTNLLDIGCGKPCRTMPHGAFLKYLQYGTGTDVFDMDIGFPFKKMSRSQLPFADDEFDVVVALETLEHVSSVDKVLKEIRRVLKTDGIFIMSTPNNKLLWRTIWFTWEKTFGRDWKDAHFHKNTQDQWIARCKKYFELTGKSHFNHLLLVAKFKNLK